MDAVIDTSVVIEIFGGNKTILNDLRDRELTYGITTITLFELYCGTLKEKEELMIEKLPKLEFEERSAKIGGEMFRDLKTKGRVPPAKDLLIAATAIAHDKSLLTCDRDFEVLSEYGLQSEKLKK
ncbi:MAG: type II toxin-antitoxin system VapC family toxin [Archaeoglobaceae archaeon]